MQQGTQIPSKKAPVDSPVVGGLVEESSNSKRATADDILSQRRRASKGGSGDCARYPVLERTTLEGV